MPSPVSMAPGSSWPDVPLSARSRAEPPDRPSGADAQRGHRCEQPGAAGEIPQLRPLSAPGGAGGASPALVEDLPGAFRGEVRCGATGAGAVVAGLWRSHRRPPRTLGEGPVSCPASSVGGLVPPGFFTPVRPPTWKISFLLECHLRYFYS